MICYWFVSYYLVIYLLVCLLILRFEVVTAVTVEIAVFLDMAPGLCLSTGCRRGKYCSKVCA